MPAKKRQHFVPQHYLRQFRIETTNQIVAAKVDPFKFIGAAAIKQQCQADYFYGADGVVEEILATTETEVGVVLNKLVKNQAFRDEERMALCWLAVTLHVRTRKAAERAKIYPRRLAYEYITHAIATGRLPPPPGGKYTEDMMNFEGVAAWLVTENSIGSWLEMKTLNCKLLLASSPSFFLTSDNPVVLLNQFFAKEEPLRSYVGFSRSGFQVVLPVSPRLCLFFYDAKVYKVGARSDRLVTLSAADVELINSLQIQSAEECVYLHDLYQGSKVEMLVNRYAALRESSESNLRVTDLGDGRKYLHSRQPSAKLKQRWSFCQTRRHVNIGPEKRRDALWTEVVDKVVEDIRMNPSGGELKKHFERGLSRCFGESVTLSND